MFTLNSNNKFKIRIESASEFDLNTFDARLNTNQTWKIGENGLPTVIVFVNQANAAELCKNLLTHPLVISVNDHITPRGQAFFNDAHHLNPALIAFH